MLRSTAAPPPGWRRDWASALGLPLLIAARAHLVELPVALAAPGDVLAFRTGPARLSHVGILAAPGRAVHAVKGTGVVETDLDGWHMRPAFAFRFPLPQ